MTLLFTAEWEKGRHSNPQVGISFVAMKRNIADLPRLPWLATYIGATEIQVSNLVPHVPEMEKEILYGRSLQANAYRASRWVPNMNLPKLDMTGPTLEPLSRVFASIVSLSARNDYCRFAQEGYMAIRWDGQVSPDCSHNTFPTCGGCLWAQGFVQCP